MLSFMENGYGRNGMGITMAKKNTVRRSLGRAHRLNALSIQEIVSEFEGTCSSLGEFVKFQNRKLKAGPLLNAIVLDFLKRKPSEQLLIVERSLPMLEELLTIEPPKPKRPTSTQARRPPRSGADGE